VKNKDKNFDILNSSRRDFIKKVGTATAGILAAPYLKPSGIFGYDHKQISSFLTSVAITNTTNSLLTVMFIMLQAVPESNKKYITFSVYLIKIYPAKFQPCSARARKWR